MTAGRLLDRRSYALFSSVAFLVVLAETLLVRSVAFARDPDLLALAVTFDFVVTVPLLFYLLVVRRGDAPWPALVPVVVLSWLAASRVLPAGHHQPLRAVELLFPLVELALFAVLAIRIRRVVRAVRRAGKGDLLTALRAGFAEGLGDHVGSRVLADELATWGYAFSFRRAPGARVSRELDGAERFTYHRTAAWGGILLFLLVMTGSEGLAVHFFIARWSVRAAWLLSALTAYGLVWLIGDYRAMARRTIDLEGDLLRIRLGLRWTVDLPVERIAAVERRPTPPARKSPGYLRVTPLDAPDLLLRLESPVTVHGPFGIRKVADRIGLAADEPDRLATQLERAVGERAPSAGS